MNSNKGWCSLALATLVLMPCAVRAQQKPTSQQAQQMLQTNPALLQQLRQRILTSGLSPDQVRARLRAEGYPENLLDAYLPGSTAGPESAIPSEDVFSAITQLGISDTTDVDLIRCGVENADTIPASPTDSLAARRHAEIQARCIAREDSITRGLKKRPEVDSGYVIFGLDFFRNRSTQFNPNAAGPVDANYRINPGDQLVLVLTGDVE